MSRSRLLRLLAPALLFAHPAVAQYSPVGTSDADQLAAEMRVLGTDPTNLDRLIRAGQLSLRLGDVTAAAAFFARAERISSNDPRVKAGEGSLLVQAERPGEALRRFEEAERLGYPAANFAADRALAFDLLGEQDRAQRDYRLAQRSGQGNDETIRRYALSLAISGRADLAEQQLEPLLRRSDRAAWRVRAFILAMSGDQVGAERIATSMMPPGFAEGLRPFFQRLPTLSAADRAFAVNFGEVHATAERIADARLVPPLPVLGPDAYAPPPPVRVATAVPPTQPTDRRSRRDRNRREERRTEVAAVAPLPAPPAYVTPSNVATNPVYVPPPSQPVVQPLPRVSVASVVPLPSRSRVSGTFAASSPGLHAGVRGSSSDLGSRYAARPTSPPQGLAPIPARTLPPAVASAPTSVPAASYTLPVRTPAPAPAPAPVVVASVPASVPVPVPSLAPVTAAPTGVAPPATFTAASPFSTSGATSPVTIASAPPSTAGVAASVDPDAAEGAPLSLEAPPPAAPVRSESAILSSIISTMGVPATELGVQPLRREVAPPRPAQAPSPAPVVVPAPRPVPSREPAASASATSVNRSRRGEPALAAATPSATSRRGARASVIDDASPAVPTPRHGARAAADTLPPCPPDRTETRTGRRGTPASAPARGRGAAADTCRPTRSNRNDPAILYPARTWVQVAGGASDRDLARAWATVRDKAPAAFRGHQGWTVPVRATNRVLAGPFATQAQAQAFLNQIVRAGVNGFVWNSEAGQEVDRLTTP